MMYDLICFKHTGEREEEGERTKERERERERERRKLEDWKGWQPSGAPNRRTMDYQSGTPAAKNNGSRPVSSRIEPYRYQLRVLQFCQLVSG